MPIPPPVSTVAVLSRVPTPGISGGLLDAG